jgi:hypothetical protein
LKIAKIVTHDQKTFFCQTLEELKRFMSNYRTDEEERLKREFPDEQFLLDHIEVTLMTKEEYQARLQADNKACTETRGKARD